MDIYTKNKQTSSHLTKKSRSDINTTHVADYGIALRTPFLWKNRIET